MDDRFRHVRRSKNSRQKGATFEIPKRIISIDEPWDYDRINTSFKQHWVLITLIYQFLALYRYFSLFFALCVCFIVFLIPFFFKFNSDVFSKRFVSVLRLISPRVVYRDAAFHFPFPPLIFPLSRPLIFLFLFILTVLVDSWSIRARR